MVERKGKENLRQIEESYKHGNNHFTSKYELYEYTN